MHSNVLRRHLFDGQFASLYLLSVLRSLTLLFLYLPIYWAFMYMRSTCFSLGMFLLFGNVRAQSFIKIHYIRWQLVFFLVSALFLIGGRSSRMGSWSHSICNTSVENNLNYHQGFINTLTPVVRKMVEYTFPKFVKNFKACLTIL